MSTDRFPELEETMAAIGWAQPFWSTMIYDRLGMKVTESLPTLGVDGRNIHVNQSYFVDECDAMNRISALCHEVAHAMFMHPEKMLAYKDTGLFGKPFDSTRYNMAADFVINDMLKATNVGRIKDEWLWSPSVSWQDSVEEVYKRLEPPNNPGSSGGGGKWKLNPKDGGAGSAEYFDGAGPEGSQDTHMPNESGVSEIEWKTSIEAAAIGAKAVGSLHVDMERMIADYIEPKRDWRKTLRDFIVARRGRDRRNWKRASARKMHRSRIYVPTRLSHKIGKVGLIGDRSGSVTDHEQALYKGALVRIFSDCKPKEIYALGVTTQVTSDDVLATAVDIEKWNPRGSGGTDMEAGFRFFVEQGYVPDVCIVLTDGYTPFNDGAPPFPVIWVTTGLEPEKFPYGRAVTMDEE